MTNPVSETTEVEGEDSDFKPLTAQEAQEWRKRHPALSVWRLVTAQALVEAMAAGCACVASDVVGVRGVIDPGKTGELVPEGDPAALAAVLERLLTHPAEAARLGRAARQAAETRFDRHLMHARYAQLLLGLSRSPEAGD